MLNCREREEGLCFLTQLGSLEMELGALYPETAILSARRFNKCSQPRTMTMGTVDEGTEEIRQSQLWLKFRLPSAVLKCLNFQTFRHLFGYIVWACQNHCLQLEPAVLYGSQGRNHICLGQNTQGAQWVQVMWLNKFTCVQASPLYLKSLSLKRFHFLVLKCDYRLSIKGERLLYGCLLP